MLAYLSLSWKFSWAEPTISYHITLQSIIAVLISKTDSKHGAWNNFVNGTGQVPVKPIFAWTHPFARQLQIFYYDIHVSL